MRHRCFAAALGASIAITGAGRPHAWCANATNGLTWITAVLACP